MEIDDSEATAKKYGESEGKYNRELSVEKGKFMETKAQAGEIDPRELVAARMAIRQAKEQKATQMICGAVHDEIYPQDLEKSKQNVDHMLDEDFLELRYRAEQRYVQREQRQEKKARSQEWDR